MNCGTTKQSINDKFQETTMSEAGKSEFLSTIGFILSDSEIASISDELSILFGISEDDIEAKEQEEKDNDPDGKSALDKAVEEAGNKLKARVQANEDKEAGALAEGEEALVAEGHIVQDSKEVLEVLEPTSPDTMFTSPIDLKKAGYSIQEDYPDTYGFVDTVKNWYKINKKQKYAEYVHASGSMLKMDKDGNTTIEIKGKLKFIQRGEMTHFIGDNLDIAIDGSFYHHIMGELKQLIDGDNNQDVGGNQTITIGGNQKTTATRIDLN